jgi:PTS system mannose-specific IIC component
MDMFGLALLIFLITFITSSLCSLTGASCLDRPLFIGGFLGLILGDVTTGVIIGAQLELIFMGISTIGLGGQTVDILGLAAVCTTLGITHTIPIEIIMVLGMVLGYVGNYSKKFMFYVSERAIPYTDKAFLDGNQRKYTFLAILFHFAASALRYIWVVPVIMLGGDLIAAAADITPIFVLQGISIAGGILPAIGFAVILTHLWNAKLAVFFFMGFAIMKYLEVDMMFLFVIAAGIGITNLFLQIEIGHTKSAAPSETASEKTEEENFLS